jgi:solute carrier family 25 uncoupling protein 8/9
MKDNMLTHCISGFSAGFIATIIASPFDVVKTRIMASPTSYSGVLSCFYRTLQEEGALAFYNGFVPNFTRLGTWSIITFVSMEQFKILFIGKKTSE